MAVVAVYFLMAPQVKPRGAAAAALEVVGGKVVVQAYRVAPLLLCS